MLELPTELLLRILEDVDFPSLVRVCQTCRALRGAIDVRFRTVHLFHHTTLLLRTIQMPMTYKLCLVREDEAHGDVYMNLELVCYEMKAMSFPTFLLHFHTYNLLQDETITFVEKSRFWKLRPFRRYHIEGRVVESEFYYSSKYLETNVIMNFCLRCSPFQQKSEMFRLLSIAKRMKRNHLTEMRVLLHPEVSLQSACIES